jgi:MFS family permease
MMPTDVLRIRDFRFLLQSRFMMTLAQQMQEVVLGWQVYQLTRDPLSLGLVGLFEALAFISLVLFGGHVADQREKRALILSSQFGLLAIGLFLAVTSLTGLLTPALIYAMCALGGALKSFLWPATFSFSEMSVPKDVYASAAAWNSTAWQTGAILGPAIGGLILGYYGAAAAHGTSVVLMALAGISALNLGRMHPIVGAVQERAVARIKNGIAYVFNHPVILPAMMLDMIAVFFGGAVALLPIFAERLGVGAVGLGLLRTAPAVGALLMALYQARHGHFSRTGWVFLGAVAVFGISTIGFAVAPYFWLALVWLALGGAADNISVVIRASIMQAMTPDAMRGRVSAVNGIFIGSSNELGAFESGVAARLLGTVPAVIFGGAMTLLTVAFMGWRFPALRRLDLRGNP